MSLSAFLQVALRDLKGVGALTPSSKYTIQKALSQTPSDLNYVLEYGPGDGVITRELLKRLSPDGRLLALETNGEFVEKLNGIPDARLLVVEGKAQEAHRHAKQQNIPAFDLVISGIPFTYFSPDERAELVSRTSELLRPGGVFLVYQYSPLMLPYLKREFDVKTVYEPRNFLPYFIMRAEKA